jgi:hypothetical protein
VGLKYFPFGDAFEHAFVSEAGLSISWQLSAHWHRGDATVNSIGIPISCKLSLLNYLRSDCPCLAPWHGDCFSIAAARTLKLDWHQPMGKKLTALLFLMSTFGSTHLLALGNDEPVEFHQNGYQINVTIATHPFATYYFDPAVTKPYLFPLRSAKGTVITRSFPMLSDVAGEVHDEPHQRAMYFAHGSINGFDFWGEAAFPKWSNHSARTFGRTVFRKLDQMIGGAESGALRVTFDLVKPDGTTIAEETQAYAFRGDENSRTIDCEFTIHASEGPVEIGDTKEGTFAIRLVKALDSPPGHMVNSAGATGEKEIWGKRADWVDYYGNVSGEDVGIAIFDHPENFRHPTYWHARAYGLLAANPFGVREFTRDRHQDGAYTIPAGGSLILRYRVLIHHGDYREAQVADAYKKYAAEK